MKLSEISESKDRGWVGIDLDGTIAYCDNKWHGPTYIGKPIPKMVEKVKKWIKNGKNLKILTARANDKKSIKPIENWCKEYLGKVLPITNKKDKFMIKLYDDRVVQIEKNTGIEVK